MGAEPASSATSRPKVGLALSGGGARGGAHLGVLRVLEEHRVPIDYIAGTSMGAIMGGLYASGMTADEIEAAITGIDREYVLEDPIERQDRSFRRKRDDDLFVVKHKPGFSDGELKLPTGLIQGQKIDLILSELTLPVHDVHDFDELSIPFRAVAGDIATGEAVALGSGNLAKSIRASMSVPAVFSPIVIDGRMLVDGGVANNIPIDVVREMGADIVIAVDISTHLKPLTTLEDDAPVQNLFRAGGFLQISGFEFGELTGQHFAQILGVYFRDLEITDLLPVYAGASVELGNTYDDTSDIDVDSAIFAGSLWLGADTVLGPLYLAYGRAEGGNDAFYLFLGRQFGRGQVEILRQ